jgi:hypothetical protein
MAHAVALSKAQRDAMSREQILQLMSEAQSCASSKRTARSRSPA